jgi:tetratricopeptide (TPR) repeat protein
LTNQATEASCWATLAIAQVNVGQAQDSIHSGQRALALAKEIKNVWVEVSSTNCLTNGLLEVGAYEESLTLMQHTMALARILPSMQVLLSYLHTLGRTYHTLQQWEAAQNSLEEAVAVAETLNLGYLRVPALSQMCMHYSAVGDWEQAYRYAVKASAIRNSSDLGLHPLDYYLHFETEACLRKGDERKAREDVKRLGERLGSNRRSRIPYLRALAVLAEWEGHSDQAIDRLRDAARVAADLSVPAELWQIQAALGMLYETAGDHAQARAAFGEAARIIWGLAEGIKDEALRLRFLAGPQIQLVEQHAHSVEPKARNSQL